MFTVWGFCGAKFADEIYLWTFRPFMDLTCKFQWLLMQDQIKKVNKLHCKLTDGKCLEVLFRFVGRSTALSKLWPDASEITPMKITTSLSTIHVVLNVTLLGCFRNAARKSRQRMKNHASSTQHSHGWIKFHFAWLLEADNRTGCWIHSSQPACKSILVEMFSCRKSAATDGIGSRQKKNCSKKNVGTDCAFQELLMEMWQL